MAKGFKKAAGLGVPTANQNDNDNKNDEKAREYTVEYGGKSTEVKKVGRIICPNCETEIKPGMKVCPICGQAPDYYKSYIPPTRVSPPTPEACPPTPEACPPTPKAYPPTREYRFPTGSLVMFLLSILGIIVSVVMFTNEYENGASVYKFFGGGWGDLIEDFFGNVDNWRGDDIFMVLLFFVSVILLIIFGIRLLTVRKR